MCQLGSLLCAAGRGICKQRPDVRNTDATVRPSGPSRSHIPVLTVRLAPGEIVIRRMTNVSQNGVTQRSGLSAPSKSGRRLPLTRQPMPFLSKFEHFAATRLGARPGATGHASQVSIPDVDQAEAPSSMQMTVDARTRAAPTRSAGSSRPTISIRRTSPQRSRGLHLGSCGSRVMGSWNGAKVESDHESHQDPARNDE